MPQDLKFKWDEPGFLLVCSGSGRCVPKHRHRARLGGANRPHSHEDLHDEKLQQQNPAVHYGEGDEKSPAAATDSAKPAAEKDTKEKNGGTKQENGKKHENGKADKTNTPV
ncbi:hypothetical protein pipiens_014648 [Culex pipiens pipiens]|uniref:Uncharacterized protein n=1 Tax=Culex pipiens pipiens TaxID=38569 RepID=A0ABD1CTM5_CULPP